MILVTGANGLVGSFLCKELIGKGYRVRALIRKNSDISLLKEFEDKLEIHIGDLNDAGSLIDAMNHVECIVHTAAMISFWSKRRDEMFQTNVEGTRNILNAALEFGIKKFIHISSVAAIGRKVSDTFINETNTWEESALNTRYAVTKHQAELEVYRAVEEGLNAILVNPSIILGPALKGTSTARLFEYVAQKNKFYTEGYMNYVDVRDVVSSILFFIENQTPSGERYILNAGIVRYKEFFEAIAQVLNIEPPKISARPWMRALAWRFYAVKSFFTGKEPLITRETASVSAHKFEYQSDKIKKTTNIVFNPLKETVVWTCANLFKDKQLK
ncbi:NAD-dependent epimerase/dehydratase family protein [Cytophaga aurantiaca]|uniref:NAD-dependent epimerase/dehydratase family protein n=1 Tax=Cytophaga aurantiaca TaxID=29530 RepID=UPI00035D1124|nr:NAD-dependent epimerase/dehydratase family protein [Cytophaga aurantiaca]